jgi:hypothetical protein
VNWDNNEWVKEWIEVLVEECGVEREILQIFQAFEEVKGNLRNKREMPEIYEIQIMLRVDQ